MQSGILLINKEKGLTSRDVVNLVSKKLNTKKVGHAGTLDPIATGLLVIGVGKATKILDLLTMDEKEYQAKVKIGLETDTLDITGEIVKQEDDVILKKTELEKVLKSFQGEYMQEVPKYSAVKINGKKLYEYARNNQEITCPKRLVKIKEIELLDFNEEKMEFTFKTLVSKGTYIRSLIKDIGEKLSIPMTMLELERVKSGKFSLENSFKMADDFKFLKIEEALDFKVFVVNDLNLLKKIKNGNVLENYNLETENDFVIFKSNDEILAIYKKEDFKFKAFKVF